MKDETEVLSGWDINSVDPCTWNMVGCSSEGFVESLYVIIAHHMFDEMSLKKRTFFCNLNVLMQSLTAERWLVKDC